MNYINIYNKIVEYRQSNLPENSYTENHHIIPKCLGGDNSKENLVTVSTKEHYILHHLLIKIYPENTSISKAFKMLRNRLNVDRTNNPYSCIRKCEYIMHSEEARQKISKYHKGKIPWNKNIKFSDITKQKMSESHIGKTSARKGVILSDETKRKMSESNKNKIWVNNGIITKFVNFDNIPEGFVRGRIKKTH